MKKCARKKCRNIFLEAFFSHSRKLFSKFPHKIFVIALHEIIGVQNFSSSFCKSKSRITMCNLHWCYTFCTGVTLFALVLHLNCTALSQSESSNFFMCIISYITNHLMTGPLGNSEFCFPRISGNIEILGKQNSLFPSGPVINC